MDISLYAIPAIIALAAKAALFFYAHRSNRAMDITVRLYLAFLAALTVTNIAEIGILSFDGPARIDAANFFVGQFYYVGANVAPALLLHLSLVLGLDWQHKARNWIWSALLYAPAIAAQVLLASGLFFNDFYRLGYTYNHTPGPGYWVFEVYTLTYLTVAILALIWGSMRQNTPTKRLKAKIMVLGMLPMVTLVMFIIVREALGATVGYNANATLPVMLTLFLAITAYAIYQHRIFDINFYIPWSKVRRRKTAFYNRIRRLIGEISMLPSTDKAVALLADTFHCPIVLVDNSTNLIAVAGNANRMAQMDRNTLSTLTDIVVREEIAAANPALHNTMAQNQIAAVVPFRAGRASASYWMLIGESFNERVYSRLDFKHVERVFDKMADLFLERMIDMRGEVEHLQTRIQKLEHDHGLMATQAKTLEMENIHLRREHARLLNMQSADPISLASTTDYERAIPVTLTLLGRDKEMLARLRTHLPQSAQYVSPTSVSFKRQTPPDVLICRIDTAQVRSPKALLRHIDSAENTSALLLYGPDVIDFVRDHRALLMQHIVEVIPADIGAEALAQRVNAITALRKSVCAMDESDYPILGRSQITIDLIADAVRAARFTDPIVIRAQDNSERLSLGAYIHKQSQQKGGFVTLGAGYFARTDANEGLCGEDMQKLRSALFGARNGTLMLDSIETLSIKALEQVTALALENKKVRLILGTNANDDEMPKLPSAFQVFILDVPDLKARGDDAILLMQYYTLLYNLQAESTTYLSQANIDAILMDEDINTLPLLKACVFDALAAKTPNTEGINLTETAKVHTLEDHVNELEIKIIRDTLKRCDGNKSKAARLLGLRPNTLHYKMMRHGLMDKKTEKPE